MPKMQKYAKFNFICPRRLGNFSLGFILTTLIFEFEKLHTKLFLLNSALSGTKVSSFKIRLSSFKVAKILATVA